MVKNLKKLKKNCLFLKKFSLLQMYVIRVFFWKNSVFCQFKYIRRFKKNIKNLRKYSENLPHEMRRLSPPQIIKLIWVIFNICLSPNTNAKIWKNCTSGTELKLAVVAKLLENLIFSTCKTSTQKLTNFQKIKKKLKTSNYYLTITTLANFRKKRNSAHPRRYFAIIKIHIFRV